MTFSYTPFIALWIVTGLLSAWFFRQNQYRYGLFLLFLTGFALRFWAASLDPFLHDWDERFHAIVAKNMMHHPFKPMLRANPAVAYDYTAWCCNHVWLHKQPLFLWQMALSMRLFGVNELALRLPSVLAGALLVFPIFGIGRRVYSPVLGYLAAFGWTFGYFSIELAAGVIGMDHNDLSFAFYITCSVWAFFRYLERSALRNALLMGAFAGAAILCKWLVGLLVFGAFGVYALLPGNRVQKITHGTKALLMTLAVAVPWQIYTFVRFPLEAAHEMSYNLRHLAEVVETKGGDWAFYWRQLPYQYGYWAEYLLVAGLVISVGLTRRYPRLWYLLLLLALPFIFFSFLAKTKMIAYIFCVGPLVVLVLLMPMAWLLENIQRQLPRLFPAALAIVLVGCGAYFLRPLEIWTVHVADQPTAYVKVENRAAKVYNNQIFRKINELVPPDYILLNTRAHADTEAMFFSDRTVYQFWLDEKEFAEVRARGQKVAVLHDFNKQCLPPYILNDSTVLVIDVLQQ